MSASWSMTDDRVSNPVSRLADQVSTVEIEISSLSGQVDDVTRDVRRLLDEEAVHEEQLEEHGQRLRTLGEDIETLRARSQWLEQHLRAADPARTANLDQVTQDVRKLAATAEKGQAAQARIMSDTERSVVASTVRAHAAAVKELAQAVDQILTASTVLAETRIGSNDHQAARSSFLYATATRSRARNTIAALTQDARAGVTRLAADDVERAQTAATIQSGQRARAELMTRLRTRLAEAVGQALFLPVWLTRAMGLTPPASGAERWLDVASEIWAYRVTYRVTDPVSALGSLPAGASSWRRAWHHRLQSDIRLYGQ
jgi:chromosome segregation ATPase